MNASIRKEIRSLAPVFAITVALTTVGSMAFNGREAADAVSMIFGFGCVLIGAWVLGNEFQSRTMGVLLSQPRTRQQIWGEKMAILGVALGLALGIAVLGVRVLMKSEDKLEHMTEVVSGMVGVAIIVFCTTPCLTLGTKKIIGGMVLTVGVPMSIGLLIAGADAVVAKMYSRPVSFLEQAIGRDPYPFLIGIGSVYCGIVYWLGYRKFMRLQVIEGQGQEVALPAKLERRLGTVLKWFVPGYTGEIASLVRKELLIQRPGFIVAGLACVLLICEALVWSIQKTEVVAGFLGGTIGIYAILIPFICGGVCVAEERGWGVAATQLTLPVSATRQATIKLLVTIVTCLFLGVAIPLLLLLAGQAWFGIKSGMLEMGVSDWGHLGQGYLVGFSLIVYASSRSKSAIKAVIAALALIVVFGSCYGLIEDGIRASLRGGPFDGYKGSRLIVLGLIWLSMPLVWFGAFRNARKAEIGAGQRLKALIYAVGSRRKLVIVWLLVLSTAGFVCWEVFRARDPEYKGKPLSEWLQGYDRKSLWSQEMDQRIKESDDALRFFLRNSLPAVKELAVRGDDRVFEGLGHIGKAAEPMTDVLEANLTGPNPTGYAAGALANLGPKSVAILTNATSFNSDLTLRIHIALALGHYGELAKGLRYPGTQDLSEEELAEGRVMATPILLRMLEDPSPKLALIAADSLARFHCCPDVVVPVLVKRLRNSKGNSRANPLYALARYGEQARSAVPEILRVIHDPETWTGQAATNALKAIDPETAAKMGIK